MLKVTNYFEYSREFKKDNVLRLTQNAYIKSEFWVNPETRVLKPAVKKASQKKQADFCFVQRSQYR